MFRLRNYIHPNIRRSLEFVKSVRSVQGNKNNKNLQREMKDFFFELLRKVDEENTRYLKMKDSIIFWTKIFCFILLAPIVVLIICGALYLWWNLYLTIMVSVELCYLTLLGQNMTF